MKITLFHYSKKRVKSTSEDLMTDPQKRFLRVVLFLAEKTFIEIKNLAQQQTEKHRLYVMENHILEERRAKLLTEVDEALEQIEKLADILDLDREFHDISKIIFTRLLGLEEDFSDVRPKRLRGYGEVSPKLVQIIEPWLEEFNTLIRSMMESLRTPARKNTNNEQ